MGVRAFISPHGGRAVVLVGRGITPRLVCMIVSRRASLVVHFKSAGVLLLFFFIFAGLVSGCARRCVRGRVVFGVGVERGGASPAHHQTIHYFDPDPNTKTGRKGWVEICGIDLESAVVHFWLMFGFSCLSSFFSFLIKKNKVEGGERGRQYRERVRKRRGK